MEKEKKSIVYLAGAISGVDDYADKFRFWENVEREKGNIVLNPAKLPEGMPYQSYMPICLAMIMAADEVLILPYSDTSKGVAAEKTFAVTMGKKIRRLDTSNGLPANAGESGVFIPGMRMPECCEECIMCDCNFNDLKSGETIENYMCLLEFNFIGSDHKKEDGRRDFCPLKEIKA